MYVHLDEPSDGLAVCGHNVLLISMDNLIPLSSCQIVLWQMQVDLITIKISIEGVAVGVVHANDPLTLHTQQTDFAVCCLIHTATTTTHKREGRLSGGAHLHAITCSQNAAAMMMSVLPHNRLKMQRHSR